VAGGHFDDLVEAFPVVAAVLGRLDSRPRQRPTDAFDPPRLHVFDVLVAQQGLRADAEEAPRGADRRLCGAGLDAGEKDGGEAGEQQND